MRNSVFFNELSKIEIDNISGGTCDCWCEQSNSVSKLNDNNGVVNGRRKKSTGYSIGNKANTEECEKSCKPDSMMFCRNNEPSTEPTTTINITIGLLAFYLLFKN